MKTRVQHWCFFSSCHQNLAFKPLQTAEAPTSQFWLLMSLTPLTMSSNGMSSTSYRGGGGWMPLTMVPRKGSGMGRSGRHTRGTFCFMSSSRSLGLPPSFSSNLKWDNTEVYPHMHTSQPTHAHNGTQAHPHLHTHVHPPMYTMAHKPTHPPPPHTHKPTHTCTQCHTHTSPPTHAHNGTHTSPPTHAHNATHTQAHPHMHTQTHMPTHTCTHKHTCPPTHAHNVIHKPPPSPTTDIKYTDYKHDVGLMTAVKTGANHIILQLLGQCRSTW